MLRSFPARLAAERIGATLLVGVACTPQEPNARTASPTASAVSTASSEVPAPRTSTAPSLGPDLHGYSAPRWPDWEARAPHCVGHSHLSHCFFRISKQPFQLEPTAPPDYARWPSQLGIVAWCTDNDRSSGKGRTCRALQDAAKSPWIAVQGSSVQLRYGLECSKDPAVDSCVHLLQARPSANGPIPSQKLGFSDAMSLWAMPEGDTILVERLSFVGE